MYDTWTYSRGIFSRVLTASWTDPTDCVQMYSSALAEGFSLERCSGLFPLMTLLSRRQCLSPLYSDCIVDHFDTVRGGSKISGTYIIRRRFINYDTFIFEDRQSGHSLKNWPVIQCVSVKCCHCLTFRHISISRPFRFCFDIYYESKHKSS